jgi:hypothetical protein
MKKYNTFFFLMIDLFIFTGCGNMTYEEIKNYQWKHVEGYHIGDVLILDEHNLKGDTIFKDEIPVAVIQKSGGMFWESPELEIKSITTGKTGKYLEL